jgi:hypothetical protein
VEQSLVSSKSDRLISRKVIITLDSWLEEKKSNH